MILHAATNTLEGIGTRSGDTKVDPILLRVMPRLQDILFWRRWIDFEYKQLDRDSRSSIVDGAGISERLQIQEPNLCKFKISEGIMMGETA